MTTEDTILQTRGLTKQFGGVRAVDGVDFAIRRGSVHALIGPNGAGKTTFFNLLTLFLAPTQGTISFEGRDITAMPPAKVAQLGIVRSFQISAVYPRLTVLENVRLGLQKRLTRSLCFWRSEKSLEQLHEDAFELLRRVGLRGFEDRPAVELPYGRRRALEIAATLALDPKLMLMDEPTSGMTATDVSNTIKLIREVAPERTILMVEHNLSVVSSLADRITVFARGRILAEGDYETVSRDPRVVQAYLGSKHA